MDYRYVYILKSNRGFYKIGISKDPSRRVTEVGQTAKLRSQYRFFFTKRVEGLLHRIFEEKRRVRSGSGKTEWFKLRWYGHIRLKIVITFFKLIHDGILLSLLFLLCVGIIWFVKDGWVEMMAWV